LLGLFLIDFTTVEFFHEFFILISQCLHLFEIQTLLCGGLFRVGNPLEKFVDMIFHIRDKFVTDKMFELRNVGHKKLLDIF
jgi:hypothetical protein